MADVTINKIVLNLGNGVELSLTPDEAESLRDVLNEILDGKSNVMEVLKKEIEKVRKEIKDIQPITIPIPYPQPYPVYPSPRPYWEPIWISTTTTSAPQISDGTIYLSYNSDAVRLQIK
jgi:hypothetical protein